MSRARETLDDDEPSARNYRFAGRKLRTDLDYDTIETICVSVADFGTPFADLANSVAIAPMTLTEWRRKGDNYAMAGGPANHEIYGDFVAALTIAAGTYAVSLNRDIQRSKEWFRFLKIAERRMPETYGVNPQGGHDQVYNPDDKFL